MKNCLVWIVLICVAATGTSYAQQAINWNDSPNNFQNSLDNFNNSPNNWNNSPNNWNNSPAKDDLSRNFYRTLKELRIQQAWRKQNQIIDVTP